MGIIFELVCYIGDVVYEIIVDNIGKEVCLDQYIIQDVSLKAIKYCDEWKDISIIGYDIFLNKDDAEKYFQKIKSSSEYNGYKFFKNNKEDIGE